MPDIIINLSAYGNNSFEQDLLLTYKTNFELLYKLFLFASNSTMIIQIGSSSEYGNNVDNVNEDAKKHPNSHYAVSKLSSSYLIDFMGHLQKWPCVNLRPFAIYGPYEDSHRLIPSLIANAKKGKLIEIADPKISRDFVYVDDLCEAIYKCFNLPNNFWGNSYNICTGVNTTLNDLMTLAKDIFKIDQEIKTNSKLIKFWDQYFWYGDGSKALKDLNFKCNTDLRSGLLKLKDETYLEITPSTRKISIIVACFNDAPAITELHQRLQQVFSSINYNWELIIVDDCSPDNSLQIIQELSKDSHVFGIRHSRNFGSQAAFLSGLSNATGDAFVFMDGDLQDPPEVILDFIKKWEDGYDIVYGIRAKREGLIYSFFQKIFYLLFRKMANFHIPLEAGDFALMDIKVKSIIDQFAEKNVFLRTLRSYIGFRQGEVKYFRPKRKYGKSTNSVFKYFNWATFAFMSIPYNVFKFFFILTLITSITMCFFNLTMAILLFFNGLGVLLLGRFVRFILIEVKKRPLYIQESFIKNGKVSKL